MDSLVFQLLQTVLMVKFGTQLLIVVDAQLELLGMDTLVLQIFKFAQVINSSMELNVFVLLQLFGTDLYVFHLLLLAHQINNTILPLKHVNAKLITILKEPFVFTAHLQEFGIQLENVFVHQDNYGLEVFVLLLFALEINIGALF